MGNKTPRYLTGAEYIFTADTPEIYKGICDIVRPYILKNNIT
jgi:hypothetical protein